MGQFNASENALNSIYPTKASALWSRCNPLNLKFICILIEGSVVLCKVNSFTHSPRRIRWSIKYVRNLLHGHLWSVHYSAALQWIGTNNSHFQNIQDITIFFSYFNSLFPCKSSWAWNLFMAFLVHFFSSFCCCSSSASFMLLFAFSNVSLFPNRGQATRKIILSKSKKLSKFFSRIIMLVLDLGWSDAVIFNYNNIF